MRVALVAAVVAIAGLCRSREGTGILVCREFSAVVATFGRRLGLGPAPSICRLGDLFVL